MAKRVKIVFFGNTKGTERRFFIKQKALELGLKGYCTLNSERRLEVEVEGRTTAVDEFIVFIKKGVSSQTASNEFSLEIFKEVKGYTAMESDIV